MNELRGLWRGKREDSGKWVEGYRVELPQEKGAEPLYLIIGIDGQYNRVDPKTYGECTGSPDKNGKPIFEGDIVEYDNEKFIVQFIEGFATFDLRSANNMRHAPRFTSTTIPRMSVVGNIYDNPELQELATGEDSGNADQDTLLPAT